MDRFPVKSLYDNNGLIGAWTKLCDLETPCFRPSEEARWMVVDAHKQGLHLAIFA